MPRNIALVISYDGTDFAGWQIQDDQRSVQGEIEKALADLHENRVVLTGAGRTDSGVHAMGQVGNFRSDKDGIPEWKFRDAINARLPRDVRIMKSYEVPESFHSRRDATRRYYEYRMIEGQAGWAHLTRFAWLLRRLPSLSTLNDMARCLCGRHDFTTFAAAGDSSPNRIRDIHHAVFLSEGPFVLFRISGNAFLWRMVRSLLGTMIDSALRGGDAETIRGILASQDRDKAGPTAPARGLFLSKVEYGSHRGIH